MRRAVNHLIVHSRQEEAGKEGPLQFIREAQACPEPPAYLYLRTIGQSWVT